MKSPPAALYRDVVIFGAKSDPPKIGGSMLQPDIARSYLLAARYVLEGGERSGRLSEVVLPAAYLQRHALEVELKDIIDGAREITADKKWLEGPVSAPYPTPEPAEQTHDLDKLLGAARTALAEAAQDAMPQSVVDLVSELDKLDNDAPDRLRYRRIKLKKPKGNWQKSFPEPTRLPVVDTQERFEAIYLEHLLFVSSTDEPNFGSRLVLEADHWGNKVAYREHEAGK